MRVYRPGPHAKLRRDLLAALLLTLAAAAGVPAAGAQGPPPDVPRLVEVALPDGTPVSTLIEAGLDVVEVHGARVRLLEWPVDRGTLTRLGLAATLVDADPAASAAARARTELGAQRGTRRTEPLRAAAAPPIGSGSMGGYWTLDEVKMKLDELVANDTQDLVAELDTIGTTVQGRPIWGLRLGKAVTPPDTRPVAFYNALTHAREPAGMQALLYFVEDLLAKYGSDPEATYLLDHRVIYVVPVVNPDGYEHNRAINPGGGGLWRKNLRDNDGSGTVTGQDGVDLNRNYGHQWACCGGSSGSFSAQTYRGPAPFSEPETQAQRDVIVALQPKTGLSFHTYSDLLLHPWGYTTAATGDSAAFYEWNDDMSLGNGYLTGQGIRVLYAVDGEFNDWAYGDVTLKPRAYTWTPEVGDPVDGFWPAPSRILPLAQENLRSCWYTAYIAGPFVRVERAEVVNGPLTAASSRYLRVRARNKGLATAGPGLTATMSSLSAGASVLPGAATFPALPSLTSGDAESAGTFLVAVDDSVTPGRLLRFRVDFTAPGGYFSRDTVELISGVPTVLALDDASSLTGWTTGSWGVVSNDPAHPSRYFADSPAGPYANNANNPLTHVATFDLSPGVHAYALYDARWQFQSDYDCGLIEASLDGVTWTPVAAYGSSLGRPVGVQPAGKPLYDGARFNWRTERADLSPFTGALGNAVRLRFRVLTNGSGRYDGLFIDSLRVLLYDPSAQPSPVAVGDGTTPERLELAAPSPTPARGGTRFAFALPQAGRVRLALYDLMGRRVATLADGELPAGRWVRGWDGRDDSGRAAPAGVYLARLESAAGSAVRRFIVLH